MLRSVVVFLLTATASLAQAQTPKITESYRADVKRYLELTGAMNLADHAANTMIEDMLTRLKANKTNVPEKAIDIIKDVISKFIKDFYADPETLECLVKSFANYFSQEEIKQLIAFYESPVGKKFAANQVKLFNDAYAAIGQRMTPLLPKMQETLIKRFAAENVTF